MLILCGIRVEIYSNAFAASREGATLLKWSVDTSLSYMTRNVYREFHLSCAFLASDTRILFTGTLGAHQMDGEDYPR